MQTLMLDYIMSLDGYGGAEGWPGFWGMEGPEYLDWLDAGSEKQHLTLMGARTYRLMYEFADSGATGMEDLTAIDKVVFSSSLTEADWLNTTLVTRDAVEYVRQLKAASDRPLRTLGSIALGRSLLQAGLVDSFRTIVFPVITGATGRGRIFDDYPDVRLDLVGSRLFDGRLQLLEYTPTVLDAPPLANQD